MFQALIGDVPLQSCSVGERLPGQCRRRERLEGYIPLDPLSPGPQGRPGCEHCRERGQRSDASCCWKWWAELHHTVMRGRREIKDGKRGGQGGKVREDRARDRETRERKERPRKEEQKRREGVGGVGGGREEKLNISITKIQL